MDVNYIENWHIKSATGSKSPITQSEFEKWQRLDKINIIAMSDKEFEEIIQNDPARQEIDRILLRDKRRALKKSRFFNNLPKWKKEEVLGLTSPQLKKRLGNDSPASIKSGELPLFKKEVVHYWGAEIWKNVKKFSVFESGVPNRTYTTLDQINLLQKHKDLEGEIDLNLINNISKTKGEEMAKRALNQNETKLSDLLIQKMAIDSLLKCHEDYISLNDFNERVIAFLEKTRRTNVFRTSAHFGAFFKTSARLIKEAKTQEACELELMDLFDFINSDFPDFQDLVMSTLIKKGKEYSENENRISNFVNGAEAEGLTKKQYLFALARKHVQYLVDTSVVEKDYKYEEHALDTFNYMLIYTVCFDKFAS